MSDHLPECPYVVFDRQGQIPATVIPGGCICPSLREAYRAGYSKGVRDARESASWCQDPDEMLEAIIGLLNMPPPPPLPPSVGVPEKWRP